MSDYRANLDSGVLERLVRVWHILHADAVELSLVDVRQSVVLAPLAGRDRRLQEEAEAVVGEAAEETVPVSRGLTGSDTNAALVGVIVYVHYTYIISSVI